MKDRIKQYIDYKGISPGDLASALDVQRSNISHILNGRNKPGAAFIEKMLLVYPDLNARWLLTGTGNMITGENAVNKDVTDSQPHQTETEHSSAEYIKERSTRKARIENNIVTAEIDKLVILFNDGTFSTYNPK